MDGGDDAGNYSHWLTVTYKEDVSRQREISLRVWHTYLLLGIPTLEAIRISFRGAGSPTQLQVRAEKRMTVVSTSGTSRHA